MPNPQNPQNPQNVKVSVVVESTSPFKFHFETTDLPMGPDNVLYFKNCRNNGFYVYYELVGAPGFRFPASLNEALYVKHGSKTVCPSEQSVWGQFEALETIDGPNTGEERRILKVWNKNRTPAEFAYTLRVTDGTKWEPIDPGGVNQNGGVNLYANIANYVMVALASAAIAAFATFAFIR